MRKIFYLVGILALLTNCTREDSVSLSEVNSEITEVTYTNTVKAIMDNNCISCHATVPQFGAPNSLVTYNDVKQSVLNGGLIQRMQLPEGNGLLMPQGGPKLPETVINNVIKWQADGFIE